MEHLPRSTFELLRSSIADCLGPASRIIPTVTAHLPHFPNMHHTYTIHPILCHIHVAFTLHTVLITPIYVAFACQRAHYSAQFLRYIVSWLPIYCYLETTISFHSPSGKTIQYDSRHPTPRDLSDSFRTAMLTPLKRRQGRRMEDRH